jgi:hypothetical protein
MTEEVPHGYVPVFQMKPSEKTSVPDRSTFEIKHYIIREVQKGEKVLQHISPQMRDKDILVKLL